MEKSHNLTLAINEVLIVWNSIPHLAFSLGDLLTSARLSERDGEEAFLPNVRRPAELHRFLFWRTGAELFLTVRWSRPDRRFPNRKGRTHQRADLINSPGPSIKRPSLSPCATRLRSSPPSSSSSFLPSISELLLRGPPFRPHVLSTPPPHTHINLFFCLGGLICIHQDVCLSIM